MKEKQEVDLLEIIYFIFKIIKKRRYVILSFLVIGAFVGFYIAHNQKNKIEFKSICESKLINNNVATSILNEFKKLNHPGINSIAVDAQTPPTIIVTILGNDLKNIDETKTNLFLFINKSLNKSISHEIKVKEELLAQVQKNISKIDSLQKFLFDSKNHNNLYLTSTFSNESIAFYERKITLEDEINSFKKDGVLREVTNSNSIITQRSLLSNIVLYSFISTFLCILGLFVIEFIVYINKQIKTI